MTLFFSSPQTEPMHGFIREQSVPPPSLNILFQSLALPPMRPGTLNIPLTPADIFTPPTPMEEVNGTHQIG